MSCYSLRGAVDICGANVVRIGNIDPLCTDLPIGKHDSERSERFIVLGRNELILHHAGERAQRARKFFS